MRAIPPGDRDAGVAIEDEIARGEVLARRRRRLLAVIARRGLAAVDPTSPDVRDAVEFACGLAVERRPRSLWPDRPRCTACEGGGTRFVDAGMYEITEVECARCDGTGRDPGTDLPRAWSRPEIEEVCAQTVAAALALLKRGRK